MDFNSAYNYLRWLVLFPGTILLCGNLKDNSNRCNRFSTITMGAISHTLSLLLIHVLVLSPASYMCKARIVAAGARSEAGIRSALEATSFDQFSYKVKVETDRVNDRSPPPSPIANVPYHFKSPPPSPRPPSSPPPPWSPPPLSWLPSPRARALPALLLAVRYSLLLINLVI